MIGLRMQRHCAASAIHGLRGDGATADNLGLPAGGIRRPQLRRLTYWGRRSCGNPWSFNAIARYAGDPVALNVLAVPEFCLSPASRATAQNSALPALRSNPTLREPSVLSATDLRECRRDVMRYSPQENILVKHKT